MCLLLHYMYIVVVISYYMCISLLLLLLFIQMLRLSHTTVNRVTVGHIVNLSSNDLHRFDTVCYITEFTVFTCKMYNTLRERE